MEDLKMAAQIIADSESKLQRRVNMLGQHLTNAAGMEGVKITFELKVRMANETGEHTKTMSGEYSKYTAGNGSLDIGGNGGFAANSTGNPSNPPAASPAMAVGSIGVQLPATGKNSAWGGPRSSGN